MAALTGSLTTPGNGSSYPPPVGGKFSIAVSGQFQGAAVLVYSMDGGETFEASPTQGTRANGPLLANGGGVTRTLTDTTAGVLYAVQAVAPPGGTFMGALAYTFTDILQALVTVAPDKTVTMPGMIATAGQQITVDRDEADSLSKAGIILPNY